MSLFKSKKKEDKPNNGISISGATTTSATRTSISGRIESVTTTTVTRRFSSYEMESKTTQKLQKSGGLPSSTLSLDAVPFKTQKVNLNYQSPYRSTSAVYGNFMTNRPILSISSTPITSTTTKILNQTSNNNKDAIPFTAPRFNSNINQPQKPLVPAVTKPVKISVKKTKTFQDKESSPIPVYKTSGKQRGEILIINNIMFKDNKLYREGAELDEDNLSELFKQMGFKVTKKRNVKAGAMLSTIREFSRSSSLRKVDICVVVVMSHGTNHNVLGSYTEVYGVDDKGVSTDEIIGHFTAEKCPNLGEKPKIFIFQCCRGNNEEFIRTDATLLKPRIYDNMLIAHSTLPGFASHRDPKNGTWYIQTICEVFSKHACEFDVETMLKIVDQNLAKINATVRQTSSYESRGFKRCFFHPV